MLLYIALKAVKGLSPMASNAMDDTTTATRKASAGAATA